MSDETPYEETSDAAALAEAMAEGVRVDGEAWDLLPFSTLVRLVREVEA